MSKEPNQDVAELDFESARDQLEGIVARLEAGETTLEESLSLWERGEALGNRCQELLDGARERIASLKASTTENQD